MRYPCIDHGRPRVRQQDRRRIIFYYGHGFEVLIEYRSGGSAFGRKPKFKLRHCPRGDDRGVKVRIYLDGTQLADREQAKIFPGPFQDARRRD